VPASGTIRSPWSGGDLAESKDHLQFRRKTALALSTENPILWAGEPAWEIDTNKGKVGDGITRYNSLPYAFGTIGGGAVTLPALTLAGNKNATPATGNATGLTPAEVRDLIDVAPKTGDYTPFKTAAEAHMAASAAAVAVTRTATASTTSATVTITSGGALPAGIAPGSMVYGHAGIPPYSFVGTVAADRLSFTLSSAWNSNVPVNGLSNASGTVSFPPRFETAHGLNLLMVPNPNGVTGAWTGWSGTTDITNGSPGLEKWQQGWSKGKLLAKSAEYPTVQQLFPMVDYTPIASHVVVPVPSAYQTWANFPTSTATDMFVPSTTPTVLSRYKVLMPFDGATQLRIVIDWLETGATGGSGAKLKAQYLFGSTWTDLCDAGVGEVAIDTGQGAKIGAWGAIKSGALTVINAAGGDALVRLVGFAASAAGTPSFGGVRIQAK
jgi:hypothetical protein